MKQFVCWVCVLFFSVSGIAQTKEVAIATDKTVSLVFPFSIRHVDRGTKDVLVQQIKEADNILLVKAAGKDFLPTNLSVVTEDGSMYSFQILYQDKPLIWIYEIPSLVRASVQTYANGILDNPRTMKGGRDHSWDVMMEVSGIYIRDETIYYQIHLENNGPIDYDLDFIRFYIRDKTKSKRTATQEIELKPLHIAGNAQKIKGNCCTVLVVALEKFTLPDAKFLAIEAQEKNGGRNLLVKVSNKKITRAVLLPELR